jgi:hypothetical protein
MLIFFILKITSIIFEIVKEKSKMASDLIDTSMRQNKYKSECENEIGFFFLLFYAHFLVNYAFLLLSEEHGTIIKRKKD